MKNFKTFMLVWFETFLLISVVCLAFPQILPHKNPRVTANLFLFIERGGVTETLSSGNTITDIGESRGLNLTAYNNQSDSVKYISWGNSTITAAKTQLDAEETTGGFNRSIATMSAVWQNSGDYAYNLTLSVIANATVTLNACGVQWSATLSSGGNLFALAALPQTTTFNSGDNSTAVWVFTFDYN